MIPLFTAAFSIFLLSGASAQTPVPSCFKFTGSPNELGSCRDFAASGWELSSVLSDPATLKAALQSVRTRVEKLDNTTACYRMVNTMACATFLRVCDTSGLYAVCKATCDSYHSSCDASQQAVSFGNITCSTVSTDNCRCIMSKTQTQFDRNTTPCPTSTPTSTPNSSSTISEFSKFSVISLTLIIVLFCL